MKFEMKENMQFETCFKGILRRTVHCCDSDIHEDLVGNFKRKGCVGLGPGPLS